MIKDKATKVIKEVSMKKNVVGSGTLSKPAIASKTASTHAKINIISSIKFIQLFVTGYVLYLFECLDPDELCKLPLCAGPTPAKRFDISYIADN